MNKPLILEHKTFVSAKRAAEVSGYASDYVGQLCRAGKLECKMVGRAWFITEESLRRHQLSVLQNIQDEVSVSVPTQKKEDTFVFEVPVTAIEKPAPAEVQTASPAIVGRVSFVPQPFALPYSISQAYLFAPTFSKKEDSVFSFPFFKISVGFGVFMIAFFFMFQSLIVPGGFSAPRFLSSEAVASAASVSQEFVEKVFSFFNKPTSVVKTDSTQPEFNGLAVAPASGSIEGDETIKQRIKDSFSDEVQVQLDDSGTSGIVTPVFKRGKGDDFIYVLVPSAK